MRKTGDARIVQQDYRLLKSMEQEGERLSKKTGQPMSEPVQKTSAYRTAPGAPEVVSSTNSQGGVH